MRVYRQKFTYGGECRTAPRWYIELRDANGRRRRFPLYEDRTASMDALDRIKRIAAARAVGDVISVDLQRWLDSVPDDIRDNLAAAGFVTAARAAAGRPLAEHVTDYYRELLNRGNTERHAQQQFQRISAAFSACGFRVWGNVEGAAVQAYLAAIREDVRNGSTIVSRGKSASTANHILRALHGFCRWMVAERRAIQSPLSHLRMQRVTELRKERRALTESEISTLLGTVPTLKNRWNMPGRIRAMVYRLALETGLRAGEIRALIPSWFEFFPDGRGVVRLPRSATKNAKGAALPLRAETVGILLDHLKTVQDQAPVFPLPPVTEISKMLRKDLADCKIPYVDSRGRCVDFHALRHTFISSLAAAGVHPSVARELARHSTVSLTLQTYTHTPFERQAAAIDSLPIRRPGAPTAGPAAALEPLDNPAAAVSDRGASTFEGARSRRPDAPAAGAAAALAPLDNHTAAGSAAAKNYGFSFSTSQNEQESTGTNLAEKQYSDHETPKNSFYYGFSLPKLSANWTQSDCTGTHRTEIFIAGEVQRAGIEPATGGLKTPSVFHVNITPQETCTNSNFYYGDCFGLPLPLSPELLEIAMAWPMLPPEIRAAVTSMSRAAAQVAQLQAAFAGKDTGNDHE